MSRIGKDKQRFDVAGLGGCAVDLFSIVPSFGSERIKSYLK